MAKEFYDTLGVAQDASQEDIKRAYRKLSKELHPDKHKGEKDAETKYKAVNEAYETLSDSKKRQAYDQFGKAGAQGGFGGGQGGFNPEDLGGFSDIFESFFGGQRGGGGGGRGRGQDQGQNVEVELVIDFDLVIKGGTKTIRLNRLRACDDCSGSGAAKGSKTVKCSDCGGTGQVTKTAQSFFGTIQQNFLCSSCKGKGEVPEETCKQCDGDGRSGKQDDVTVSIPAGIHEGQTLRMQGEGQAGHQGAPSGDLFVHIRIQPDKNFERDGDDIRSVAKISVLDAILGTTITVKTAQGDVKLKVPDGTQPSQVFRLKGKGLPVLSSSRHGDHYVTAEIEIPTKLSRTEKKLMEEWKKMD